MLRFFLQKVSKILKKYAICNIEGTSPSPSPHLPVDVGKFFTNFIVTQKKDKISKKKNFFYFENFMTSTVAVRSIALFEGQK